MLESNPNENGHQKARQQLAIPKADMDEFLRVAEAFKTIRDKRLFREEFDSFDAYCRSKWGKSAQEVNWLIAEADMERQVRKQNPG